MLFPQMQSFLLAGRFQFSFHSIPPSAYFIYRFAIVYFRPSL